MTPPKQHTATSEPASWPGGTSSPTSPTRVFACSRAAPGAPRAHNPDATTYARQVRVGQAQDELLGRGVLDADTMTFAVDHDFDNWNSATQTVSGKAQYS